MSLNRQQALHEVLDRVPNHVERPSNKISEYFGRSVQPPRHASSSPMRPTRGIWKGEGPHQPEGGRPNRHGHEGVGDWTSATHYTHWFQPLTGSTAENTTLPTADGRAIENRRQLVGATRARRLVVPGGGIRNTFEHVGTPCGTLHLLRLCGERPCAFRHFHQLHRLRSRQQDTLVEGVVYRGRCGHLGVPILRQKHHQSERHFGVGAGVPGGQSPLRRAS